jgi:hypothetical protein
MGSISISWQSIATIHEDLTIYNKFYTSVLQLVSAAIKQNSY